MYEIESLKQMLGTDKFDSLKKALAASNNFYGVNLEAQAKLMLPFVAPLRNRIPVDRPKQGGLYAWYKAQLGFSTFDFASNMGISAEAGNGGSVVGSALDFQAVYSTTSVHGEVNFETIPYAAGYDDPLAVEVARTLAILMRQEEIGLVGGNYTALARVTGLTAAAGGSSSGFATTNYDYVNVTPLTLQGYLKDLAGGYSAMGEGLCVASAVNISGAGGTTDYVNVTWNPVPGAVAYRVAIGHTANGNGNNYLLPVANMYYLPTTGKGTDAISYGTYQTCVTTTGVQIQGVAGLGTQKIGQAEGTAQDGSTQYKAADGLYAWCEKETMYGTDEGSAHYVENCGGKVLTTSGAGVDEFDAVLANLWTNWKIGPTLIISSPKSVAALTNALIEANSSYLYRIELAPERGGFVGGAFAGAYLNKFAANMDKGKATIPIWAHPEAVDGTFLIISEDIPYQYSREGRGLALDVLQPYTYFPLAQTTRTYPFDVFMMQTLKCYHPLAQAAIVGARVE